MYYMLEDGSALMLLMMRVNTNIVQLNTSMLQFHSKLDTLQSSIDTASHALPPPTATS